MAKIFVCIFTVVILSSCTKKIYLAAGKVDCNLRDKMQCFLVKQQPDDNWILSTEDYVGFDYQPGYQYKVKVKRARIKTDEGTSKRVYKVLEVLEKINKRINDSKEN